MRYDGWKKNIIKSRIYALEQIENGEMNDDLITIINELREIYKLIDVRRNYFKRYTCQELLVDNFRLMSEYDFLWDVFINFGTFQNDLIVYPYEGLKTNFSNQEILDLTYDFYRNGTDKEIFSIFDKLFNKSDIRIFRHSKVDFRADTLYLPYYNELLMQLKPNGEVTDLSNMVHEFGHGIHLYCNYRQSVYRMNPILLEIVSTFFEDISLYYYGQNGEFKSQAILGLIEIFELCKSDVSVINEIINIYRELNINSSTDKNLINYRINQFIRDVYTQDIVTCLLLENPHVSASYIISKLISIELFNIYLSDPDKAFYLLKKIMMIDLRLDLKQYYQEIINLGLIPGNSTLKYNNYLKRELSRIKK